MIVAPHDVAVATHDIAKALHDPRDRRRFIRNLTEAIVWCTASGSLSNPEASLRTCEPTILIPPRDQVFGVCSSRSMSLWHSARGNPPAVTDLCGGRLVAYFPSFNLADGAAAAESKGFFDVDNVPPYDTWVWMVRNVRTSAYADGARGEMDANYLVAWVPPDLIQLANAGVAVNPEACILWLDTLDDEFVRSLRRLGFIT